MSVRSNMNEELKLQVGVKVLLENEDGDFLVLKKHGKKYNTSDYWDIPGGRIDVGSSLEENLEREVKEEIGLDIDLKTRMVLISAQDIIRPERGIHVVRLTYKVKISKSEVSNIVISDDEHLNHTWMSKDDLESDDNTEEILKGCLKLLK